MIAITAVHFPVDEPTALLLLIATAAARAVALAGVAGTGLAVLRVRNTSLRLLTWTGVLYGALAMPLLERVLPPMAVPAPAFLQHAFLERDSRGFAGDPSRVSQPIARTAIKPASTGFGLGTANQLSLTPSTGIKRMRWSVLAAAIYFAGVFLFLVRFLVGLALGSRLRRASRLIGERRLRTLFALHAEAAKLRFIPDAVESALVSAPVTMGLFRPVVLFPTNWRNWDDTKLEAVTAHELSHIARRDTLTQRLSFLHCAIFWFNPLVWWLNTGLSDLMEQASDEAALAYGVDRADYAKTLLSFFERLQETRQRVWWQGVSMANVNDVERRLDRILDWKGAVTMSLKKSVAVVVVLIVIPVVYLTASAKPSDRRPESQGSNANAVYITQEQAPTAPTPPSTHAGRATKSTTSSSTSSNHSFYSYSDDESERFVIVSGDSDSLVMSGTRGDGSHVEVLRKTIPGDFIWFERDGKSYIIRDQATVNRAKAFWAPQEELGKKQEDLGKLQEGLGQKQEALGQKMEQVRVNVPDMSKDLEKLQLKLKELSSSATMEQIAELQSEIGELQSKIGELQSHAGDEQSKLGTEMGALGEQQGKLGEQQGELGRQQEELAKQAVQKMKGLLDEALAKGTAQPEGGRI